MEPIFENENEDDIDIKIIDKYPAYKNYLENGNITMVKLLTSIMFLKKKAGHVIDKSNPFYNMMMNYDENIFNGTEYMDDIIELLTSTITYAKMFIILTPGIGKDEKEKICDVITKYKNNA
jgi:hypothetical protein